MNGFIRIGITLPTTDPAQLTQDEEARRIAELLQSGTIDIFHIRKPSQSREEIAGLISAIPSTLHVKLTLHSCFNLAKDFEIGGFHFNSRCSEVESHLLHDSRGRKRRLSRSLHTLEEVAEVVRKRQESSPSYNQREQLDCYDYVTLSPVYDSISKQGYQAKFSPEKESVGIMLKEAEAAGVHVIALGGVSPEKLGELAEAGFSGCAMLGSLWKIK